MTTKTTKSLYWQGMAAGAPFVLVVVPFSILFGVVATEAGLSVFETMVMTALVIAGAAQFTAVQLLSEGAPTLIALVTALAVNLRMAMYSASLTPHLGAAPVRHKALIAWLMVDQAYACASLAYERNPGWSVAQKASFYFGTVSLIVPLWGVFTFVGAVVGEAIPPEFALDFAVPITFLAMIGPMLRTQAHMVAAGVAITVSLLLAFLPYSIGVLLGGLAGMIAGAEAERQMARRGIAI